MSVEQELFNRMNSLRASMWARMSQRPYYKGDDSLKAKTLTITHFCQEQFDGDWPPEDAAGFMAWFQAKLDEIPEEFRGSAEIELDSQSSYEDSHYAEITIRYKRPETAEEIAERRAGYAAQLEREEGVKRAQLERLKAELGE